MKYNEIFIGLGKGPLCCTAIIITEDASDLLSVELSIFSYMIGLSMINMLRDMIPLND